MMIVINQFGIPDNSGQIAAPTTPPLDLDFPVWRGEWVSDKPQYVEWHKTQAWERIKTERDRRKYLGVKVGAHWFHSDDPSRIQQLALAMMGAAIPAGLQWKTLTKTSVPVFVDMTPALASGIFQATAASDAAIFAAAEWHRVAMEASDSPESYAISAGWPVSFEDAQ
jgi:hypothetical protein